MKQICVSRGTSNKLAQYHNCSVQQVRAALRGNVNSALSATIRATAKTWGFKEVSIALKQK